MGEGEKKKILIVDDEGDFLEVMTLRLQSAGFDVATACDGTAGLAQAASYRPDIIVLDVLMPDMDGWEVCRRLRANPQTKDIPVVILTALPPAEMETTATKLGVKKIVVKPFDEEALIGLLKS